MHVKCIFRLNLIYLQKPDISDPCTTLPISDFVINVTITFMNESERTINESVIINGNQEMYNVSYIEVFGEELMPNATYCFNVTARNIQKGKSRGKYSV